MGCEIEVASGLLTFTVITGSFLHDLFCSCSYFWLPKCWVVRAAQLSWAFPEKALSSAGFKPDKWLLWTTHPCIPRQLSTLLGISLTHFYCPVLQISSLSQTGSTATPLISFVTSSCSISISSMWLLWDEEPREPSTVSDAAVAERNRALLFVFLNEWCLWSSVTLEAISVSSPGLSPSTLEPMCHWAWKGWSKGSAIC